MSASMYDDVYAARNALENKIDMLIDRILEDGGNSKDVAFNLASVYEFDPIMNDIYCVNFPDYRLSSAQMAAFKKLGVCVEYHCNNDRFGEYIRIRVLKEDDVELDQGDAVLVHGVNPRVVHLYHVRHVVRHLNCERVAKLRHRQLVGVLVKRKRVYHDASVLVFLCGVVRWPGGFGWC